MSKTKGVLNDWQLKERWNWNCAAAVVLDWAPCTHHGGGLGKLASWLVTAEVFTICSVQQRMKWLSAALFPLLLFVFLKESKVWLNSKWVQVLLRTKKKKRWCNSTNNWPYVSIQPHAWCLCLCFVFFSGVAAMRFRSFPTSNEGRYNKIPAEVARLNLWPNTCCLQWSIAHWRCYRS